MTLIRKRNGSNCDAGLHQRCRPLKHSINDRRTIFDTRIDDFQAQVVNAGVGVLRGYLANAERVRVRGLEIDASLAAAPVEAASASENNSSMLCSLSSFMIGPPDRRRGHRDTR